MNKLEQMCESNTSHYRSNKLELVARQVVANGVQGTYAKYYSVPSADFEALREALAEQSDEIDWIETNKALAKEIIEMKKQAEQEPVRLQCTTCGTVYAEGVPPKLAEQEPVAWFVQYKNRHEFVFGSKPEFIVDGVVEPLYAAPIRTKDLTPHEITALIREGAADGGWQGFAQRVIAADKAKNNLCERTK